MEKVQATLEFSLQLKQFQIPFFLQSGCWQIKTSFEILTSIPHTIEARIFHTEDNVKYPASVEGSDFFSSAFKLKKSKRAIRIDDVVIYTVNVLLDESQIEETLNTLESKMNFGLYYEENHKELSKCKRLAPMWREDMKLHFNLHRGIHGRTNIVFESCAKLSIIVHGLLVVLQPPLKTFSKKNSVFQRILPSRWTKAKKTKVESVILGKNFKKKLAADGKSFVIEEKYLQHAYRFLSTLRSCLLLSYDGLYSYFISVSETLPSSCKLELEKLDLKVRLSELSDKVAEIEDPNDLADAINSSLIELSAQLLNLWGKFLQSSFESEQAKKQIKEEKFKKLFFSTDHPQQEAILYDEKITKSHKEIYEKVKKAPKDDCLECRDTDMVSKSAPVIFEDRYLEPEAIDCSEDFVDCSEEFIDCSEDFMDCSEDFVDCSEDVMDCSEDVMDCSAEVKPSSVDSVEDNLKRIMSFLSAINADDGLNPSFYAMPLSLRKGLFDVKKELRKWISQFFSNNPSKEFTLSMELDNGSNEGISVNIRMRRTNYTTDPQAIITFVYGCLGGRTAVIGHLGNEDQTLDEYDSLANCLLSQIAKLVESNSLIISRIRLFQETSEKKLVWRQLIPTQKQQSSSTGSKDDSGSEDETHLIVSAHGLGGSALDLLLIRPHIESGVTHGKIEFLMSCCNEGCTTGDIDKLGSSLLNEILEYITSKKLIISRISFIGFSLGNLIIRSALWRPEFEGYRGNLHTYLSFGGPHMGLLYPNTFLYKTGLWLEKRLHIGVSISQMALSDHKDPRQSFLYKLSQKKGLEHFKNVILVSALQDYLVPYHSARIEMCKDAVKGDELGAVYNEMLRNLLEPVLHNENCNFVRYDVGFDLPKSFLSFAGIEGHLALISSWQYLDNFFQNAGLKYFE